MVPMFGSGSSSWRDKKLRKRTMTDLTKKTYDKPYDKVFDRDYDSTPEAPKEEVSSSRTGGQGAFHAGEPEPGECGGHRAHRFQ